MRINEILAEKGMTKVELANRMGVSKQLLYMYTRNGMRIDTAERIASALGVPMWQMFISKEDLLKELDVKPRRFVCPKCGEVMSFE